MKVNKEKRKGMKMKKGNASAKAGFTLIEIIAVLLILAVLAAVAVPRYLSLVQDAQDRALDGALAAGYSQLSLTFAQEALSAGTAPTAAALATAATANPPEGSFTYTFAAVGDVITVTATDPNSNSSSGTWTLP